MTEKASAHSPRVRKLPILAVGLLLLVGLPRLGVGRIEDFKDIMISRRGDVGLLVWLSQDVLNAAEPPAGFPAQWWPSVENARASLRYWSTLPRQSPGGCLPQPTPEPIMELPSDKVAKRRSPDYVRFVASSPIAVVAEIELVNPGVVMVGTIRIAPRVRVMVSEVLHSGTGELSVGTSLMYLAAGGKLQFGQMTLCTDADPAWQVHGVGQRVLVTADHLPRQGELFEPTSAFGLRDDHVDVKSGTFFTPGSISLEQLRAATSARPSSGKR